MSVTRYTQRIVGAIASAGLVVASLLAVSIPAAQADSQPVGGTEPATVAADPLPTVQIDGVVWSQVVLGNTVYVAGSFANVRPAGAAPGVNTTPRTNLLAYDITTGNLITSWAPTLNAQALVIAASPDGSTIYAGGSFTEANGVVRSRIAAFSATTGALVASFKPSAQTTVRALAVSSSTVYFGGDFTTVNGEARGFVAAADVATGELLPFNPNASAPVIALTLNYSKSKLVMAGRFATVSGQTWRGLAAVDPASGAIVPWATTPTLFASGEDAAMVSLTVDADGVYGTGYHFGSGGNLEGAFRADNETGAIIWIEDCHGDTYGVFPTADVVYAASHSHYCGNNDGFWQTTPTWTFFHSTAFGKAAVGTITKDNMGYPNLEGNPHPALLHWFPKWTVGTYTGQGQATWSVTGVTNGDYVAYGGEFPSVNSTAQQGLVRFAKQPLSTNKVAPLAVTAGNYYSTQSFHHSAQSLTPGTAHISWSSTLDRDNRHLTYKVYRNYVTVNGTPVCTVVSDNRFWEPRTMSCDDSNQTPGSSVKYRVIAFDDFGNRGSTSDITVTIAGANYSTTYADAVRADSPSNFYRLNEPTGNTLVGDLVGNDDMIAFAGVTRGAAGALLNETDTASTLSGAATGLAYGQDTKTAPNTFTAEAWIKTSTTRGGGIMSFGHPLNGSAGKYDRLVYMDNSGRIWFGVNNGARQTLNTVGTFNNNQWHHVVASMGPSGMRLYVDGKIAATRNDITSGITFKGDWRIGHGAMSGWASAPTSNTLAGSVDEAAVYPTALSAARVDAHYVASGRTSIVPPRPADAYGAAVYDMEPSLYWRLNESSGTTAADSGLWGNAGSIKSGVTLAQAGALFGYSGTAARFNGTSGHVVAGTSAVNPTVYTVSTWFKTTSTTGGKLIGFGDATSGLSASNRNDRHIFIRNDGRLDFGAGADILSPLPYNNGAWHLAVGTQGPGGMRLYVDGQLVGSNTNTSPRNYTGYWRIGGDRVGSGATSSYINGTLDESAVFGYQLSQAQVSALWAAGNAPPPNQVPTAAFTHTETGLTASFDASSSTDADGTISTYTWDFGDGTSGTGVTPNHNYALGGTYQVKLTVTDDDGATGTITHPVIVVRPANELPEAAFTTSINKLALSVNAGGSSDPDGTIDTYAWDFGDGSTGSGQTATHTYTAGDTYTVSLTITDDRGGTDTETHDVVATANAVPVAAFTTDINKLALSVDASSSSDADGTISDYAWDFGDGSTGSGATATHTYTSGDTYTVRLTVTDDDGTTDTVTHVVEAVANVAPVAAFTSTEADLTASFDASGTTDSDGTISSYAWNFGDGTTGTGRTPTRAYATADTYTVILTVTDNNGATDTVSHPVTVTAPTAGVLASDTFSRTLASGWGSAETGGPWTLTGSATLFAVNGGVGTMSVGAGKTPMAHLTGVSSLATDLQADVALDKLPDVGSVFMGLTARGTSTNGYRGRALISATGTLQVNVSRVVAGVETVQATANVAGVTYAPGAVLHVRMQVSGSGTTTVRIKAWVGATEPTAWQVTSADTTAALQVAGGVGIRGYLSATTTNGPVTVRLDKIVATTLN